VAEPLNLAGLPQGFTGVRLLGRSPLSEVFLVANDEGRLLALKVLRESAARDPRIRERWRREAALLEEIHHPHLIRSHGELEIEGRPGLLLEYIDGPSLRERLQGGPLRWEEAARIGIQVAQALGRLHRHGALHRDVKPHNILLDPARGAVLADLGLVRRREDPTLTAQGTALGSPAYMSPEQARDPTGVGPEADVYSLGATLHHALSGRPPFLGRGVGEVIHRVMHTEPEPLPDGIPDPLLKVLRTAMQKEPQRRYARARDLAADLGRVLLGASPRLLTRHRLGVRRVRRGVLSALGVLLVAGLLFWNPRVGTAPIPETAAADSAKARPSSPSVPPLRPGPEESRTAEALPSPRLPSGPPPLEPEGQELFLRWVIPFQQTWRRYESEGRLGDALAEVDAFATDPLPEGGAARLSQLRRDAVRAARSSILASAERIDGRARELLDLAYQEALRSLGERDFDGEGWEKEVLRSWQQAGLVTAQLPLEPGGPDPRGRLRMIRSTLEHAWEKRMEARAREFLPDIRRQTAELLRKGDFLTARQVWESANPALLRWTAAGRRELVRVTELSSLERRVLARLDELAGTKVHLELRFAALEGRLLPRSGAASHNFLDLGTRRIEIGLLDFDPAFLPRFLLVDETQNLRWVLAQLLWCQNRTAEALKIMRPLAALTWPAEKDPAFWVGEWEGEVSGSKPGGVERVPAEPSGPGSEAPARPPGGSPPAPATLLARDWGRALPDARVEVVRGGIEILFEQPSWGRAWERELKWDRRRWSLEAWRVEWSLPAGSPVPERVDWLGSVHLLHPSRSGPGLLRIGDREIHGLGIVAGARQVLSWQAGKVRLDGLPVGELDAPGGNRLRLSSAADPGFQPLRVWLRVSARNPDSPPR